MPQVTSARVGSRLHGLLPFRDRRVHRLFHLRAELCHSVVGVTGDAGSLSLAWPAQGVRVRVRCALTFPSSAEKYLKKKTYVGRGCGVFGHALCVFCRRVHLLCYFWRRRRRLFCLCPSGGHGRGGGVRSSDGATRQVRLGLHRNGSSALALATRIKGEGEQMGFDLGDEGCLFCGDACLCGAVVDFFGELGGRSFGLDDGSGSLVSVRGCELRARYESSEDQSTHSDISRIIW